jgi:cystathionine beta-lyase
MSKTSVPADETRCVQHALPPLEGYDALSTPVYRASTITFPDAETYRTRASRNPDGYAYGLYGTPTVKALEASLTDLHQGVRTVAVPSGQAAITLSMLTVLRSGDHLLIPDNVYPPVKLFARDVLEPFGVVVGIYDPMDVESLHRALIPGKTKLVWAEAPGSTSMEVCDLPAIAAAAHDAGAMAGCDNTWASPLLCKPLNLGLDFVAEALTKYVGGHSDLLLGSVTFRDYKLYAAARKHLGTLGIGVSADDCWLALRGLETMPLRLERSGRVAQDFAERLASELGTDAVLHPALAGARGHEFWRRDFVGASGVFTVKRKLKHQTELDGVLNTLNYFAIGASWGGTRSVIAPIELTNDRDLDKPDGLDLFIRISIGVESPEDLWRDLSRLLLQS